MILTKKNTAFIIGGALLAALAITVVALMGGCDFQKKKKKAAPFATISCAPDQTSLQTCINNAAAGDVINLTAGNATWSALTVNGKALTINGTGIGSQTITLTGGASAYHFTKSTTGPIRFKNMTWSMSNMKVTPHPVVVDGPWPNGYPVIFQIMTINLSNADFMTAVTPGGVIISQITQNGGLGDTLFTGKQPSVNTSWTTKATMGMGDTTGFYNFYIEDSVFNGGNVTDCDDGCRIVVRHNVGNDSSFFNSHGADTSPFGMMTFEIYENDVNYSAPSSNCNAGTTNINQLVWIRGGTGVIFNNHFDPLVSSCWGTKGIWKFNNRNVEDARLGLTCAQVTYPTYHALGQSYNGTATITDPIYIWGNVSDKPTSKPHGFFLNASSGFAWGNPCGFDWNTFFRWGRDAINTSVGSVTLPSGGGEVEGQGGTAKPGYTPYTYPHPLVAGTPPPTAPVLTLTPNPAAFGTVAISTPSSPITITVQNTGNAPATLLNPHYSIGGVSGVYTRTGGTCPNGGTVNAGGSCTDIAVCTPNATGLLSGTFQVSATGGVSGSTALTCTGGATPIPVVTLGPRTVNFGTVNTGSTSAPSSFTLTNSGTATLNITSISSSNTARFPVSGSTCGLTLAASNSCTFQASFSPIADGALSAIITVTTNASTSPDTINLTGTGFTPAPQPTPAPAPVIFLGTQLPLQPIIGSISVSGTCNLNEVCKYVMACSQCNASTNLYVDNVLVSQTYSSNAMTFDLKLTPGSHSYLAVNLR